MSGVLSLGSLALLVGGCAVRIRIHIPAVIMNLALLPRFWRDIGWRRVPFTSSKGAALMGPRSYRE